MTDDARERDLWRAFERLYSMVEDAHCEHDLLVPGGFDRKEVEYLLDDARAIHRRGLAALQEPPGEPIGEVSFRGGGLLWHDVPEDLHGVYEVRRIHDPDPEPEDMEIAECDKCGGTEYVSDGKGLWCGNENCRAPLAPATSESGEERFARNVKAVAEDIVKAADREIRRRAPDEGVGDGWHQEIRYRREFHCACGYIGWEYRNDGMENTLVCTHCGNGRRRIHRGGDDG